MKTYIYCHIYYPFGKRFIQLSLRFQLNQIGYYSYLSLDFYFGSIQIIKMKVKVIQIPQCLVVVRKFKFAKNIIFFYFSDQVYLISQQILLSVANNYINKTMIYSKIQQIVPNKNKQSPQTNQLAIGISDYIPFSLKFQTALTIVVNGKLQAIVNTVLWSQFYSKTLLKECQHHLLLTYASEGQKFPKIIFAKVENNIHKLDQIIEWDSQLRQKLAKSKLKTFQIVLECFGQTGKSKKIYILFGQQTHQNQIDLYLNITSSKNQKNIKSKISHNANNESNSCSNSSTYKNIQSKPIQENTKGILQDRNVNLSKQKKIHKGSQFSSITSKAKGSIKSSKKTDHIKQNTTEKSEQSRPTSRLSNKTSKTSMVKELIKQSRIVNSPHKMQKDKKLPEQPTNNRQRILSKLLSTKEDTIATLKQKIVKQQLEYEQLLRQQRNQRQQEIRLLTQNVKLILGEDQALQKENHTQIIYLKERLRILEEALLRKQAESEQQMTSIKTVIEEKRAFQDSLAKVTIDFHQYKQNSEHQIKKYYEQNQRISETLRKEIQKSYQYRKKYEDLVAVMRKNLPVSD